MAKRPRLVSWARIVRSFVRWWTLGDGGFDNKLHVFKRLKNVGCASWCSVCVCVLCRARGAK